MKKIVGLLFLALSLHSCDDGEVTLQSFAFESQNIQKCTDNNLIFKIKNEELLLINTPVTSFENTVTPDGEPRIIALNSNNQIIYRKYSSNLSYSTICGTIPSSSPVVIQEWLATGGNLVIETDERFAADGITLIGYTHNITFQNVSFSNSTSTFSFTSYLFGDYETGL